MPYRRTTPKRLSGEIPPALRAFLETGERESGDVLAFLLDRDPSRLHKAWRECRKVILCDWIARCPGTRPWAWWVCDAPQEPVPGWPDDRAAQRKRLGGTGTPQHEVVAVAPHFDRGVPVSWFDAEGAALFGGVAVDEADPPRYESEAAYLQRHNLLSASEQRAHEATK